MKDFFIDYVRELIANETLVNNNVKTDWGVGYNDGVKAVYSLLDAVLRNI